MHTRTWRAAALAAVAALLLSPALRAADKPPISLDEFFDSVAFTDVELSPDGGSVVVATKRPDWPRERYRDDLWLYRDGGPSSGTLVQLTQSGHDTGPQWSPDGRWVAFLSDRERPGGPTSDSDDDDTVTQLYAIAVAGGEAFPVTTGDEDVHAFAWSPDSKTLYFATRTPLTEDERDARDKEWKDVIQYRRGERGDEISSIDVAQALALRAEDGTSSTAPDDDSGATPGARVRAHASWRVQDLAASPDGAALAFDTTSISERQEVPSEFEVFVVDLATADGTHAPRQVTHNEAFEQGLRWAGDSRHLFFQVDQGSVEGKYQDTQERLYWVDSQTGSVERWAAGFGGALLDYGIAKDGTVVVEGRLGTEVQLYALTNPGAAARPLPGRTGTYEDLTLASGSPHVAFVHSTLTEPTEVYLADGTDGLAGARAITSFNRVFTERAMPQGKPYRWTADDGTPIEGMLIYPPGKFEAKGLPMLTLIHGGPADADGNHFEADWYQWSALAATHGWLVFQPNYRGSAGYGDAFLEGIVPEIVSRPGKDILEGVDALVKDGIADPDHLAIAGYSYGGYMTNWLITQTTRFKAAMTGAGAVEHVANWGNDDMTVDDAYFLGGRPWEAPQRYRDEAAIFQIVKVKTPTHMVAGANDIRVAVLEDYLLDHALHSLGVPSTLLIFPGEGHSLAENPWHGKIKVREELKWLEKYGGKPQG